MLLGTLRDNLLCNLLTGKVTFRVGEGTVRAVQGFLMAPHPLTNFEIKKYYENEPKFNGACSRNNFPNLEDGAYVINRDEYKSIGTHWTALYVDDNNVTYLDSFGVKHIPKEIRNLLWSKHIVTNIYSIQTYDSLMCEYFYIGFIDFMLQK